MDRGHTHALWPHALLDKSSICGESKSGMLQLPLHQKRRFFYSVLNLWRWAWTVSITMMGTAAVVVIRAAQSSVSSWPPVSLIRNGPTVDICMRHPRGWLSSCDLFPQFRSPQKRRHEVFNLPGCRFSRANQRARPLATAPRVSTNLPKFIKRTAGQR